MPLEFDTARVSVPAAPQRTDITCFVGYVRTRNAPLPRQVTEDLRAAGWIDGPWRRSEAQVRTLEQLPVAVESWDAFDQLFDWRSRPVAAGSAATCATYLGAAVRRFFAQGGRRAIVVRVGDPWPFMDAAGTRAANRDGTHRAAGAAVRGAVAALRSHRSAHVARHPAPLRAAGSQPRVHARSRRRVRRRSRAARRDAAARADQRRLRRVQPLGSGRRPTISPFATCTRRAADADGLARLDQRAGGGARASCVGHRRDVVLIGALPLMASAAAHRDPLAYLEQQNVLVADGAAADRASSAFVQLAYPWLSTRAAADLPQLLEPPDGLLTGADRCRGARPRHVSIGGRQPAARRRRHRAGGVLGP